MPGDVTRVGFIGAGLIGRPMIGRIHSAGFDLTVYARRPEVRDELGALGIRVTADAAELASSVDLLEVCLYSDAQMREVLIDCDVAAAMRPGAVLVGHVTGNPTLYDELTHVVRPGVSLVDAPFSGTAAHILRGELTVLLGGTDNDVERVRPVVASFASKIIHAGPLGYALRVKLVNNLLFAVQLRLAGEAVRIGEDLGIGREHLVPALMECSGASWALGLLKDLPFSTFEGSAMRYLEKDVSTLKDVAAELGVNLGTIVNLLSSERSAS
jgi:3-hydroxyisobutyrate dehydrogenase-like beta-hydroxyacid dehydrogenase